MARKALFILLLSLWPSFLGFGPALTESDDVRLPIGSALLPQIDVSRPPAITAKASLLLDLASGRVVYQRNAHDHLAPASITKTMTAVIALEQGNLQEKVTIQKDDLVEGSSMGLQVGDSVTLEQLVWGMLLPSGNDAAQAVARVLGGGSVARFVEMMNAKAEVLRLQDTHFVNTHGLDTPNHYSSAYDLALLSRYALRIPLFSRIVSTREYTVQANRTLTLQNTNQLLFLPNEVPGVNGVKTGFTDNAGDSLVASVERDGHQVLAVVLGTQNRGAAAVPLINYAYSSFAWVPLPFPSPRGATPKGMIAPVVPSEVMVPAWQRYYVNYSVELGALPSDSALTAPIGLLTYFLGAQEQGRMPLYVQRR